MRIHSGGSHNAQAIPDEQMGHTSSRLGRERIKTSWNKAMKKTANAKRRQRDKRLSDKDSE